MRKRLLSLLLCIVMCFSMLPGTVFAEAGEGDEGGSDTGYTVTFDANGGTGSMEKGQIDDSGFYTIPNTCAFINEPYKFYGWNTEKDGSGSTYESGREEYFGEEDVTLYAQWILDLTSINNVENDNYKWEISAEEDGENIYTLTLKSYNLSASIMFPCRDNNDNINIIVDGICSISGELKFQDDTVNNGSNHAFNVTISGKNSEGDSLTIGGVMQTGADWDTLEINTDVIINRDLCIGASGGGNSCLKINNGAKLKIKGNFGPFHHLEMTGSATMEIDEAVKFHTFPDIELSDESIIVINNETNSDPTLSTDGFYSNNGLDILEDYLPEGENFSLGKNTNNKDDYNYYLLKNGEIYKGPITLSKHNHNWIYQLNDAKDTITAVCTKDKCPLENGGTLQICAPERTAYGDTEKSEKATLVKSEKSIVDFNNVTAADIKYYAKNGSAWNLLDKAPVNAGNYKASISVSTGTEDSSGQVTTAYVEYTIAKADPEIPTGFMAVYSQKLKDVQLPNGWSWKSPDNSVGDVGDREHGAKYAGSDNYNIWEGNLTIRVEKSGSKMTAKSDKNSYTYGETVTITVEGIEAFIETGNEDVPTLTNMLNIDDSNDEYSSNQIVIYDEDNNYGKKDINLSNENSVKFELKNLDVGTYNLTAWFTGNDNMYENITTVPEFTIKKKTVTIKAENKSAYIGDDAPDLTTSVEGKDYTISGLLNGDTLEEGVTIKLNYKENELNMSKAGTYDIVPSADGVDSRYTFKLVNGVLTVKSKSSSSNNSDGNYYLIKASAGENGSIEKSGNISVRRGNDQKFTMTPDDGYKVADVKVDGESVGALTSYVFKNVITSHTIEVTFEKISGFDDVPPGSYYEDPVNWAVDNGITNGTSGNTFSPDGVCTRAQAVTFLWRASGCPEPNSTYMPFVDVPENTYYYKAVLWGVENKIVKGTSPTTFSPDMHCSRAHIVTFLWRTMGEQDAGTVNPFTDVKETYYYADAVLWAVKEEITNGTSPTTFSPDDDCLRSQIVTFIYRALADQL